MNKWNAAIIGIVALLAVFSSRDTRSVNNDAVIQGWSKVEAAYLQRIELLDQYISHARGVVGDTRELQALAASFAAAKNCAPSVSAKPDETKEFRDKQEQVTAAIAQLVVSPAVYPKLLADPAFRTLHDKLDAMESHLTALTENYYRIVHEKSFERQRSLLSLTGQQQQNGSPVWAIAEDDTAVVVLNNASRPTPNPPGRSPEVAVAAN